MARVEIETIVLAGDGTPITGADVEIKLRNSTLATVYLAATGGTTASNPTTTTLGSIPGWLEPGSYDLVITSGALTRTVHYEAVAGTVESRVATLESTGALKADPRFPAGSDIVLADLSVAIQRALYQVGDLKATAVAAGPAGWLLCNGVPVSRATYPALFAAIGTTYGAGDGSTTFNVPDLCGRVPVGVDGSAGRLTANRALGEAGGVEKYLLKGVEAAQKSVSTGTTNISHSHGYPTQNTGNYGNYAPPGGATSLLIRNTIPWTTDASDPAHAHAISGSDASLPHQNMPPYQVVNWLIKY